MATESEVRSSCVSGRTALYRHFDAEGKLLYVGISLSPIARLAQHRADARWFDHIAKITVEWHETRQEACRAERKAVASEKPAHNVMLQSKAGMQEAMRDARLARAATLSELTRAVTRFNPTYRVPDAARTIGIPAGSLRLAIGAGELPSFWIGKTEYVTGWAVIDYLEALERGLVTVRRVVRAVPTQDKQEAA